MGLILAGDGNSQVHYAKGTTSRDMPALTACRRTVSGTLSLPCSGCFSPFPHGTCSLSVSGECLALADGPAGFTRGSTCPALLRIPLCFASLRVRSFHALWPDFPDRSTRGASCNVAVLQPRPRLNGDGLGCSPVARRYWGNHCCFLFLRVLRCFSSPGSPPATQRDGSPSDCRVAPFGHLRVTGRLHLTGAFRSLPRPSSPSRAQASAVRPSFLSPRCACYRHAHAMDLPLFVLIVYLLVLLFSVVVCYSRKA